MFNLIGEALLIVTRMDLPYGRNRHHHDAPRGHEAYGETHGHTPRDAAPSRGLSNRSTEVRK
jgi:hypothetical protein